MRKVEGLDLQRYNVTLDKKLVDAAKEVAWSQRTTLSGAIRMLLQKYVDEHRV